MFAFTSQGGGGGKLRLIFTSLCLLLKKLEDTDDRRDPLLSGSLEGASKASEVELGRERRLWIDPVLRGGSCCVLGFGFTFLAVIKSFSPSIDAWVGSNCLGEYLGLLTTLGEVLVPVMIAPSSSASRP